MDSVEFLDAVRARHKIPSDNKLAQFLGMPQGRVATYRTGRRKLDQDACIRIAKALDLPPEHVFASIAAERAKRTEHRRIWERLAKIAKQAHVLAAIGFVGAGAVPPAPAHASVDARALYILLKRLSRCGRGIARSFHLWHIASKNKNDGHTRAPRDLRTRLLALRRRRRAPYNGGALARVAAAA